MVAPAGQCHRLEPSRAGAALLGVALCVPGRPASPALHPGDWTQQLWHYPLHYMRVQRCDSALLRPGGLGGSVRDDRNQALHPPGPTGLFQGNGSTRCSSPPRDSCRSAGAQSAAASIRRCVWGPHQGSGGPRLHQSAQAPPSGLPWWGGTRPALSWGRPARTAAPLHPFQCRSPAEPRGQGWGLGAPALPQPPAPGLCPSLPRKGLETHTTPTPMTATGCASGT